MRIEELIKHLQEIQASAAHAGLEVVVSTNGVWDDEIPLAEVLHLEHEPEMGVPERVVLMAPRA